MGPEALMMTSATHRQADLAQFARLEYPRSEARRVSARLLSEFEAFEAFTSPRSVGERLREWGQRLFRRGEAGLPEIPALRSKPFEASVETVARSKPYPPVSLVALPAARAGGRAEGVGSPLSALPTMRRV